MAGALMRAQGVLLMAGVPLMFLNTTSAGTQKPYHSCSLTQRQQGHHTTLLQHNVSRDTTQHCSSNVVRAPAPELPVGAAEATEGAADPTSKEAQSAGITHESQYRTYPVSQTQSGTHTVTQASGAVWLQRSGQAEAHSDHVECAQHISGEAAATAAATASTRTTIANRAIAFLLQPLHTRQ
eukprot:Hpha_TRINITY_DN12945_c0_g1::TRINITY_DN12945_c0_g1_i1::g.164639::m.164639